MDKKHGTSKGGGPSNPIALQVDKLRPRALGWYIGLQDMEIHSIYGEWCCCCCSVAQLCPTLCNPMDRNTQSAIFKYKKVFYETPL